MMAIATDQYLFNLLGLTFHIVKISAGFQQRCAFGRIANADTTPNSPVKQLILILLLAVFFGGFCTIS